MSFQRGGGIRRVSDMYAANGGRFSSRNGHLGPNHIGQLLFLLWGSDPFGNLAQTGGAFCHHVGI
ncbi:hypothetical protein D3C71_2121000 [compost metagenome]